MRTFHPIDPECPIRLSDVDRMLNDPFSLELDPKAREKIRSCREWLENHLKTAEHPVYGVNTGFGSLCDTRIEAHALAELQENLIRSHAVGMGEAMPPEVSRLMLWFKLHALSKGYSGIRTETAEAYCTFSIRGRHLWSMNLVRSGRPAISRRWLIWFFR